MRSANNNRTPSNNGGNQTDDLSTKAKNLLIQAIQKKKNATVKLTAELKLAAAGTIRFKETIKYQQMDKNSFIAVSDYIKSNCNVPCIQSVGKNYLITGKEVILVDKPRGIYFFNDTNPIIDEKTKDIVVDASLIIKGKHGSNKVLIAFIEECIKAYKDNLGNRFSNNLFYFERIECPDKFKTEHEDHLIFQPYRYSVEGFDFSNLFGEGIDMIEKVVLDYKDRTGIYGKKGKVHSLRFLNYGPGGVGKTSVCRAISNVLRRHVVALSFGFVNTRSKFRHIMHDNFLWVYNEEKDVIERVPIDVKDRINMFDECENHMDVMRKRDFSNTKDLKQRYKSSQGSYDDSEDELANDQKLANDEANDGWAARDKVKNKLKKEEAPLDKNGFLEIMEGVRPNEDNVSIFNTNKMDILKEMDDSAKRWGRLDVIHEYKAARPEDIINLFKSFCEYDVKGNDWAETLMSIDEIDDYSVTQAEVMGEISRNPSDPLSAITRVHEVIERKKLEKLEELGQLPEHKPEPFSEYVEEPVEQSETYELEEPIYTQPDIDQISINSDDLINDQLAGQETSYSPIYDLEDPVEDKIETYTKTEEENFDDILSQLE